ncbi:MAG: hypothetical protein CFE27_14670 [Alphaproteobacteria bacterium PA1]|nr:MAG: hypothetical protein CFE27_14670 [Alphaproteobacteria bacterium PA1]
MTAPVLLPRQVAQMLHVSPQKVTAMCRAGQIKACRIGRDWRIASDFMDSIRWNTDLSSTEAHGPQHGESAATQDGLPCEPRIVARQNAA